MAEPAAASPPLTRRLAAIEIMLREIHAEAVRQRRGIRLIGPLAGALRHVRRARAIAAERTQSEQERRLPCTD